MIKRKHIIFLFQLVLLLFVARISYASTSIYFEQENKQSNYNIIDNESSDNTEEESSDEDEKEDSINDEDWIYYSSNLIIYTPAILHLKKEVTFKTSTALNSIFIPPPELV